MISLNDLEQEVLVLKATNDLIVRMFNRANMDYSLNGQFTQVIPKSEDSYKLSLIFLIDFLSPIDDRYIKGKVPYLKALDRVSQSTVKYS